MARKLVGTVASDVQSKTIVVAVARRVTPPVYGKQYTVTKRFAAHDEANEAHVGDRVEIAETRPISHYRAEGRDRSSHQASSKNREDY